MNDALATYTAHLDSHQPKVDRLLSTPLVVHRKNLANPKKPNPVTKVAERLAEPEVVESYLDTEIGGPLQTAGQQFLAGIWDEINQTPIHEVRARFVASQQKDSIAFMLLTYLSRFEDEEAEALRKEREETDELLHP